MLLCRQAMQSKAGKRRTEPTQQSDRLGKCPRRQSVFEGGSGIILPAWDGCNTVGMSCCCKHLSLTACTGICSEWC